MSFGIPEERGADHLRTAPIINVFSPSEQFGEVNEGRAAIRPFDYAPFHGHCTAGLYINRDYCLRWENVLGPGIRRDTEPRQYPPATSA